MLIFAAEYETMITKAEAFGKSPEDALKTLIDRWRSNLASEAGLAPEILERNRDEIRIFQFEVGTAYLRGANEHVDRPFVGLGSERKYDRLFVSSYRDEVLCVHERMSMRSIRFLDPIPLHLIDETFEANLLFALIGDDDPIRKATKSDLYLGCAEFYGEGYLTFAGDIMSLETFIKQAATSQGEVAKRLLPLLQDGYRTQRVNPDKPTRIVFSEIKDKDGKEAPITIFEIVQDMLRQHPEHPELPEPFIVLAGYPLNEEEEFFSVHITRDAIFLENDPENSPEASTSIGM